MVWYGRRQPQLRLASHPCRGARPMPGAWPPSPPLLRACYPRYLPPASRTRAPLFQRGATDLFRFTGPSVGPVTSVTLRIVERGLLGTAW
jgi:hypothetical protein